jgi:hypothetical protein
MKRAALMMIVVVVATVLSPPPAEAQQPPASSAPAASLGLHAYPKNEQSASEQRSDEEHCYDRARKQTGTDPTHLAAQPQEPAPPSSPPPGAGMGRGAAGAAARFKRVFRACLEGRDYRVR